VNKKLRVYSEQSGVYSEQSDQSCILLNFFSDTHGPSIVLKLVTVCIFINIDSIHISPLIHIPDLGLTG
jgi:hypothetical protein